jgi:hypothetical protein
MTGLTQKLNLKPGQKLVVVNMPQGYGNTLQKELGGVTLVEKGAAQVDAILLFVTRLADVEEQVRGVLGLVGQDGLVWIAYPKGGSGVTTDVNRDRLWKAVEPTGWRPVRQVAMDEVWSGMRFRPNELVKKR